MDTIIKYAIVPIGQLSEDAQKANHKSFRSYRENHSRKKTRKSNNEDIYVRYTHMYLRRCRAYFTYGCAMRARREKKWDARADVCG